MLFPGKKQYPLSNSKNYDMMIKIRCLWQFVNYSPPSPLFIWFLCFQVIKWLRWWFILRLNTNIFIFYSNILNYFVNDLVCTVRGLSSFHCHNFFNFFRTFKHIFIQISVNVLHKFVEYFFCFFLTCLTKMVEKLRTLILRPNLIINSVSPDLLNVVDVGDIIGI